MEACLTVHRVGHRVLKDGVDASSSLTITSLLKLSKRVNLFGENLISLTN